jgi:POB3-like N-terminal PH domain
MIQNVKPKMERKRQQDKLKAQRQLTESERESFDNIYLDLSKESGKCRFAETGFGWKPSGGGDTFTLDASNIGGAQWSRAAKGYEVKILQRNSGIVQLDGFQQEVRAHLQC